MCVLYAVYLYACYNIAVTSSRACTHTHTHTDVTKKTQTQFQFPRARETTDAAKGVPVAEVRANQTAATCKVHVLLQYYRSAVASTPCKVAKGDRPGSNNSQ